MFRPPYSSCYSTVCSQFLPPVTPGAAALPLAPPPPMMARWPSQLRSHLNRRWLAAVKEVTHLGAQKREGSELIGPMYCSKSAGHARISPASEKKEAEEPFWFGSQSLPAFSSPLRFPNPSLSCGGTERRRETERFFKGKCGNYKPAAHPLWTGF